MRDHLEPLSVKPGFLNEEVKDWGFDVVVDNLLPPSAGDGIGGCPEEDLVVGTGAEWRATESGVDDLLGLIHESLLVISLSPKSEALSLMAVTTGDGVGGAGTGTEGSEDESSRTEEASGCARGTKDDAWDTVAELLNISSGTADAPPTPPTERKLAMEAPPDTEPLV